METVNRKFRKRLTIKTGQIEITMNIFKRLNKIKTRYLYPAHLSKGKLPFKNILIFGASHRGKIIRELFQEHGIYVSGFIDNLPGKQGTTFCDLKVYSLRDSIKTFPDIPIYIASSHYSSIIAQLIAVGIVDYYATPLSSFYFYPLLMKKYSEHIEKVYSILQDDESKEIYASITKSYLTGDDGYLKRSSYPQYLHPEVHPQNGDIVIDGGAYDGDTVKSFMKYAECKRIIALEPSPNNFSALLKNTQRYSPKMTYLKQGLWHKPDTIKFIQHPETPTGNHVAVYGEISIETISIDRLMIDLGIPAIDLIKMDIEGSELKALEGAQECIKKFKPKLQISIYHNMEDLWSIPLFVNNLKPQYRFFIGHHSHDAHESILYAI
jgi:FkbM family methyltransferase